MTQLQDKTQDFRWPFGPAQVLAIQGAANGLAVPSVRLLLALPPAQPEKARHADRGLQQLAGALGLAFAVRKRWPMPSSSIPRRNCVRG